MSRVAVLRLCIAALVALVVLKFLVLLAEFDFDPSRAPWGLLVLVVVPAAVLAVVLGRRPRAGAVVTGLLMAVFVAVVVSALLRDGFARQSWADYPFAYGGLVVAVVALVAAVQLLRHRPAH